MNTLAFIEGILSPIHILLVLFLFALVGGVVLLVVLISRRGSPPMEPIHPADADLERRRRVLEVERLELENQERRQCLSGNQPPPIPPKP